MTTLIQTRRAAKPYVCELCAGMIEPGEVHVRTAAKVGGKWAWRREHAVCPIPDTPKPIRTPTYHPPLAVAIVSVLALAMIVLAYASAYYGWFPRPGIR